MNGCRYSALNSGWHAFVLLQLGVAPVLEHQIALIFVVFALQNLSSAVLVLPQPQAPTTTRAISYQHNHFFQVGSEKKIREKMIPQEWAPPCNNQCTLKYAALMQIPWRVFCKKGCDADSETWEECREECEEICYKDPVLKDRQWSAYIDRSPGAASYSEECFHACVSGCGYKFDIPSEKADQVQPNRPCKPPEVKPTPRPPKSTPPAHDSHGPSKDDMPCTSA